MIGVANTFRPEFFKTEKQHRYSFNHSGWKVLGDECEQPGRYVLADSDYARLVNFYHCFS